MTQQELCDGANIVDQHIPSAFWPTVPRLVLWSAFNAGMARAGVGLVANWPRRRDGTSYRRLRCHTYWPPR
jgi:hypothetical protein